MAIDRTFGAALNKALRGLEQAGAGFLAEDPAWPRTLDELAGWASGGRAGEHAPIPARSSGRSQAPTCSSWMAPASLCEAGPAARPTTRAGLLRALPAAVRLAPLAPPGAAPTRRGRRRPPAGHGHRAVVPLRDGAPRGAGTAHARGGHGTARRPARGGQAGLLQRPRHRHPDGPRGGGRAPPPRRRWGCIRATPWSTPAPPSSPPRRRTSTPPMRLPGLRTRGAAGATAGGARHRVGTGAHRAGHRVRLLRRAGRADRCEPRVGRRSWSTPTRRRCPPTSTPRRASTSSRSTPRACSRS